MICIFTVSIYRQLTKLHNTNLKTKNFEFPLKLEFKHLLPISKRIFLKIPLYFCKILIKQGI